MLTLSRIMGPLVMLPRKWDRGVVARYLYPDIQARMKVVREVNGDRKEALKKIPVS